MRTTFTSLNAVAIWAALLTLPVNAEDGAKVTAATTANGNIEVLTRGPVHEAFALQYQTNAVAGVKVDKDPPELIEELPPDVRPAGDHIQWIPGYWYWDVESKDFLWVSGTYRNAPPGQRWVPGYWKKIEGGNQWMTGFWLSGKVEQLAYHSAPPKSIERGPTSEAPSNGHFWVPGVFQPNGEKYVWRPGHWAAHQQNYVWVPSRNVMTAGGYIHTPGYWDYRFDQRGTLFAPARVNLGANTNATVRFTPAVVIPATTLQYHLFAQTNSNTYLFGNYYGEQAASVGIRPWYATQIVQGVPDPMFGYYNWYFGQSGANYLDIMTQWNTHFTKNVDLRPALNMAGQLDLLSKQADVAKLSNSLLGVNLVDAVSATPNAFVNLSAVERTSLLAATNGLRLLSTERLKVEGGVGGIVNAAGNVGSSLNVATQPLKLPSLAQTSVGPIAGTTTGLIRSVPNLVPNVGGVVPNVEGVLPNVGGVLPNLGDNQPELPDLNLPGLPF